MERRFRLEPVLGYRQQLEEEARQVLARLQGELGEAREELACLWQAEEQLYAEIARREVAPRVDLAEITRGFAYRDVLAARIAEAAERIQALEEKVERQREALVAAMKDRKALENLKERHVAAYRAWLNHAEASLLDDVALAQHRRRSE